MKLIFDSDRKSGGRWISVLLFVVLAGLAVWYFKGEGRIA